MDLDNPQSESSDSFEQFQDVIVDDVNSIHSSEQGDLNDILSRLDEASLSPDIRIVSDNEDSCSGSASNAPDTDSVGGASFSSSNRDESDESPTKEGSSPTPPKPSKTKESNLPQNGCRRKSSVTTGNDFDQSKSKDKRRSSKTKAMMSGFLKKILKTKYTSPNNTINFSSIKIDKLPQIFVVKYLGKKETSGIFGLKEVRSPVDEMVGKVKKALSATSEIQLPLVYMIVSPKGIDIREHQLNKVKKGVEYGLTSIDFISYGVQDIRYWKVFTYIVVREMSSRKRTAECHAFICESPIHTRKLALSLGASFSVYSKKLKTEGKPHNFQVELRPPDALAEEYGIETET